MMILRLTPGAVLRDKYQMPEKSVISAVKDPTNVKIPPTGCSEALLQEASSAVSSQELFLFPWHSETYS